ncbi:1024_t:CDS:10 [Entrophospora sp. SA101]|nr:1024_t:CDS:10 [Entrophospora sp. SA101]
MSSGEFIDYYEILGVNYNSTEIEINKAYRKKAITYHPDKNLNNVETATKTFHTITKAYNILTDPKQKLEYDLKFKARIATKKRFESLDGKRKAMREELEEAEKSAKQQKLDIKKEQEERMKRFWEKEDRLSKKRDDDLSSTNIKIPNNLSSSSSNINIKKQTIENKEKIIQDFQNYEKKVFRSSPSTPVSASIPLKKSNKPSKTSNSASSSSSTSSTSSTTASIPFSQGRQPTVATISLAPTTTTTVVTTTTTTTTSFPPLLLNPPPLPKHLDPKEYPLADTPTPPVLKRFCFDLNGQPAYIREHEDTEEQLLKALYNMRASGPTSSTSKTVKTATYHSFNDNFSGAKPSESGARKRPASPLELTLEPPKQSSNNNSIDSNELSNHLSKTTRAYRSLSPPHKKVCAKSSSSMVTIDSRQSITPSTSSNSRHYNAMSTSNLGMDTPSTARSTQSSALPSPSLSPNNNTNQFETFFANHSSNTNMNDDDNLTTIIDDTTFDALPPSMKSYMLFQLLRRCPTNTLQYVSSIILPALRKDFLGTLPLELSLHIVRYLDASSMCKAAQVNQRWRNVVDGDGFTWKKRLLSDGFNLEESEEARAISENWVDISSSEERTIVEIDEDDNTEIMRVINNNTRIKIEGSYTLSPSSTEVQPSSSNNTNGNDNDNSDSHSKDDDNNDSSHTKEISSIQNKGKGRADVGWDSTELYQDEPNQDDDKPYDGDDSDVDAMSQESGDHVDTSDDKLPLPPSTNHPYKEIYRRHYLTRKNWSYGRHKHISFQGHGNNVVTCLQFDSEKIISGSDDQCINVYDTATGRMINRLEGHDGVWSLEDGTNIWTLEGHSSLVGLLDLSHDYLVSAAADSSLRIWNPDDGTMSSIKSLIPPKLSASGIAGNSAAYAQLSDFYSKLPKGPLSQHAPPGLLGRYYYRYFRTSSPAPILHLIVGLGILDYALAYHLHLSK